MIEVKSVKSIIADIKKIWYNIKQSKNAEKCIFKKTKKDLHYINIYCIMLNVVTLIATKREVAAGDAGVPWSECQVRKLATSHCTKKDGSVENRETCVERTVRKKKIHTGKCTVTACRTE